MRKMSDLDVQKHFAEYQLDTQEPEKRAALKKLLADPDSLSLKIEFYDRFADRTGQKPFWEAVALAFCQYAPELVGAAKESVEVDLFSSCELYGIAPEEYFQFRFYEKNDCGRNQFMGDKERFVLFRPCYQFDEYEKIRNKWLMYQQIGKYFKRTCFLVTGEDKVLLSEYEAFREYLSGKREILFKPLRDSCGNGILRIALSDGMDIEALYESFVKSGGGMLDEVLFQRKEMEQFHPQSANTVRLIVLRDRNGKNHYMQSLFRMGRGGSVVDNNSEAIRARIDESNGCVFTCGYDAFGKRYIVHPDSGVTIPGFWIPQWQDCLKLADKVMNDISGYARFIGFDLALTKEGWAVIEINPFPQLVIQQVITGRGIREEMLRFVKECV